MPVYNNARNRLKKIQFYRRVTTFDKYHSWGEWYFAGKFYLKEETPDFAMDALRTMVKDFIKCEINEMKSGFTKLTKWII